MFLVFTVFPGCEIDARNIVAPCNEFQTVLDSGFQEVDFRFFVSESWILDSNP